MKVSINAVHFRTDKKLDEFINDKLEKLCAKHDNVVGAEVTLKVENTESVDNKLAEVRILIKGNDLFAKKLSKSFEESIDNSVEALRKQLTKNKEKVKGI